MKNTIKSKAIKFLAYAKLTVAGGIGGVALYNTVLIIAAASPNQSMESLAMAIGGIVTAGLAKILHVV